MSRYFRILFLGFLFLSCIKTVFATNVSGTISTNETWTLANSPYVLVGDVTVSNGITLTIEPGVEVQFPNYDKELFIYGTLIADGTSQDSIKFYGTNPDSSIYGGYLRFGSVSSNSILDYVLVEQMGDSNASYQSGVFVQTSSITITNSQFIGSEVYGLRVDLVFPTIQNCNFINNSIGLFSSSDSLKVQNCTFINNVSDLKIHPSSIPDTSNSFENVEVLSGVMTESSIWQNANYTLLGDMTIAFGNTLEIDSGSEIKFPNSNIGIIINGTLIADGTPQDSIKFYGSNSNPSVHGGNLIFNSSSSGSVLDYVSVEKMGDEGSSLDCGIFVNSSSLTITNSQVIDSEDYGIWIFSGSPIIQNCSFSGNYFDVLSHPESVPDTSNIFFNAEVSGDTITQSVNWQKANYTLKGDVTVSNGNTLTIEKGTNVRIGTSGGSLVVEGTLIADGTPQDSIKFYRDSSDYGGTIYFTQSSTNSILDYVLLNRMGGIWTQTSSLSITNTEVIDSEWSGISVSGSGSNPVIENCLIANCQIGYYGNTNPTLMKDCIFLNNDYDIFSNVAGVPNSSNSFEKVRLEISIATESKFLPKAVYELIDFVAIANDDTLTLEPGTEFRFPNYTKQLIVIGTLIADGTPQDSIKFIGTNPAPSIYGGSIVFDANSSGSILDYVLVERMGDGGTINGSAIYSEASTLTITNSKIIGSEGNGIRIGAGSPIITENMIMGNNTLGLSNFYGLQNETSATLDVTNNWWGDLSGPFHSIQSPNGQGESISGKVSLSPWLVKEPEFPTADISPTQLISQNNFEAGQGYSPQIEISNLDTVFTSPLTEVEISISLNNSQVYNSLQDVPFILPISSSTVAFDSLRFYKSGIYDVKVITKLNQDINPDNDTLLTNFQVLGDIAISEFLNFGLSQTIFDSSEFFEIANTTSQPIDMSSWTITTSTGQVFVINNFVLQNNDFSVFTKYASNGIPYDYLLGGYFSLDNYSDVIILEDSEGRTVDSIYYNPTWNTIQGKSFERISLTENSSDANNWCKGSIAFGTLGNEGSPGEPSNCTIQNLNILTFGNSAILSWEEKTDAIIYRIYRNTISDFSTSTEIGTYSPTSTGNIPSFIDTNAVTNGQKYFYFVTWEN
ncbi:MAG: lamin tail domain-containing protein [Calditrichaeota bacterium]|nr:MAG: lamin tail domain-containing protein [Calditrichota bacterium]